MDRERTAGDDPTRGDDDPAWTHVFRRTHGRLVRLAVARGVDLDSAHDLAQEAFRLLFERRLGVTDPERWLVRVVQRRACDFWRRRDVELRALARLEPPPAVSTATDPIRRRRLALALGALPVRSRTLIRSRYFEGQDTATAARAAGYSPASYKKVMSRALARLRRALRQALPAARSAERRA